MIFKIHGITKEGKRNKKRIVSSLDSEDIMNNPCEYGFHTILSICNIDDERLEIVGEDPPRVERRNT